MCTLTREPEQLNDTCLWEEKELLSLSGILYPYICASHFYRHLKEAWRGLAAVTETNIPNTSVNLSTSELSWPINSGQCRYICKNAQCEEAEFSLIFKNVERNLKLARDLNRCSQPCAILVHHPKSPVTALCKIRNMTLIKIFKYWW